MSEAEVFEKLLSLHWMLQRYRMSMRFNPDTLSDYTRGQGRVLAMLKIQPAMSTKDLGYLLGIRQQSLNEQLNKLEKGGYIERTASENDRRVMIVNLTEKGREVKQQEARYPDILSVLNEQELETFAGYLDRVISALEEKFGNDPEDMAEWAENARKFFGSEHLDSLMQMRGGMMRMMFKRPKNIPGAERFSPDYNGPVPNRRRPENIPGAERFSPDYDGPVPDREGYPPFGAFDMKQS